jgi:hypothetical protein
MGTSAKASSPTVIMPSPAAPSLYQAVTTPAGFAVGEDYLKKLLSSAASDKEEREKVTGTPAQLAAEQAGTKYLAAANYLSSLPKGDKYLAATTGVPQSQLYKTATDAAASIADQRQQDWNVAKQAAAPSTTTSTQPTTPSGTSLKQFTRYLDPKSGQHLYTADPASEYISGWNKEGESFSTFKDDDKTEGTSTLTRLFNPTSGDHFFSADPGEISSATKAGYREEGSVGKVYSGPKEGAEKISRFYNPTVAQHFYSSDPEEIKTLSSKGFTEEAGAGFYAPKSTAATASTSTSSATATAPTFSSTPSQDVAAVEKARQDLLDKAKQAATKSAATA